MKRTKTSRAEARRVAGALSDEEKMLVKLCRELYEDSWRDFLKDIDARLAGKPYVFKHTVRLQQHVGLIRRLMDVEAASGLTLADFIGE